MNLIKSSTKLHLESIGCKARPNQLRYHISDRHSLIQLKFGTKGIEKIILNIFLR